MTEEWRSVQGYEGVYEVSNQGRVRRCGSTKGATAGRILKPGISGSGYPFVNLWQYNKGRPISIHILVAQAFCLKPEGATEVNHKDGVKANCYNHNLEWVTRSQNHRHAIRTGLRPKNDAHLERIRPMTVAWHKSEEGHAWHQAHGKKIFSREKSIRQAFCTVCGTMFETRYQGSNLRFCSKRCGYASFVKYKMYSEKRKCVECGTPFLAAPRLDTLYCSKACVCRANARKPRRPKVAT